MIFLVLNILFRIQAVPVLIQGHDGETDEYKDNWNYKTEPHRTPLLSNVVRNHTKPAKATVSSSVSRYIGIHCSSVTQSLKNN